VYRHPLGALYGSAAAVREAARGWEILTSRPLWRPATPRPPWSCCTSAERLTSSSSLSATQARVRSSRCSTAMTRPRAVLRLMPTSAQTSPLPRLSAAAGWRKRYQTSCRCGARTRWRSSPVALSRSKQRSFKQACRCRTWEPRIARTHVGLRFAQHRPVAGHSGAVGRRSTAKPAADCSRLNSPRLR
jgi:hypothetical protein